MRHSKILIALAIMTLSAEARAANVIYQIDAKAPASSFADIDDPTNPYPFGALEIVFDVTIDPLSYYFESVGQAHLVSANFAIDGPLGLDFYPATSGTAAELAIGGLSQGVSGLSTATPNNDFGIVITNVLTAPLLEAFDLTQAIDPGRAFFFFDRTGLSGTATVSIVPEVPLPASNLLFALGLLSLGFVGYRGRPGERPHLSGVT